MQQDRLRASLVARRRVVMVRYFECLKQASAELEHNDFKDGASDARVLTELSHRDLDELRELTDAIQQLDRAGWAGTSCGISAQL
jgi:hypothetical protein